MYDIKMMSNKFDKYIEEAISNLKNHDYEEAYKCIMKAINENPNTPEPQNLLGIWFESKGNNDLARKHYRMAYVLSPTYKPASVNLERVSTLFLYKKIEVDYGEENNEETNSQTVNENSNETI